MLNPVTIYHDERTLTKQLGVTDRPDHVSFPIRGMVWDTVAHPDYNMSIQQTSFLRNHMQLIEMRALDEVSINFSVDKPTVFIVIMIEGFVKFHLQDLLVSYAMAGVLYMTYNPQDDFRLGASPGKHTMMVVSLDRDWLTKTRTPFPRIVPLVDRLLEGKQDIAVLPMCRLTRPMAELWESIRIVRSDPFTYHGELVVNAAHLVSLYHSLLESGNYIKGQLSAEIANAMIMYVEANYCMESGIFVSQIVQDLGIARHKVEEYATFLFGKTLHKHIRELRMAKAAKLLKETNLTTSAIGLAVGYSEGSHFFKVFNSFYSLSPANYRERNKK